MSRGFQKLTPPLHGDPETMAFFSAVAEMLNAMVGNSSSPSQRVVTFNDLDRLGLGGRNSGTLLSPGQTEIISRTTARAASTS